MPVPSGLLGFHLPFHHVRELEHVSYGVVRPYSRLESEPDCSNGCVHDEWHFDYDFEICYRWLAGQIGFWPMFLAVGVTSESIDMTGYSGQFSRIMSRSHKKSVFIPKGKFANRVLFSFERLPDPVRYSDYLNWHIILNSVDANYPNKDPWAHRNWSLRKISSYEARLVLKPSYSPGDWMRQARRRPGTVQGHIAELDLRLAQTIWVRNQPTRKRLIEMGFGERQVLVRRVHSSSWI